VFPPGLERPIRTEVIIGQAADVAVDTRLGRAFTAGRRASLFRTFTSAAATTASTAAPFPGAAILVVTAGLVLPGRGRYGGACPHVVRPFGVHGRASRWSRCGWLIGALRFGAILDAEIGGK
jgi:hypothetical protein